MCQLQLAIEALRSEALTELPDARAEDGFADVRRGIEALEAEGLRRLADLERRGVHEREGHLSSATWLADTHGLSHAAARRSVATARALERMPGVRRALEEGKVSITAAGILAQARAGDPRAFERSESLLVQAASMHSVAGLSRVVSHWTEAVAAAAGTDTEAKLSARRRLHASATLGGMVRVDGDLDPESGEALLTALGAVVDAERRSGDEDDRSPAQRRADALGEICRGWLDLGSRPAVAGERPHLTLTVGAEVLQGASPPATNHPSGELMKGRREAGGAPELDHVGSVSLTTARRVSCDASAMRVVMAGGSEPLDVGRRTPVVSPAIRRAVVCRDRHCRFPGCDRPHAWCDAHHVVHWARGGRTAISNLVLLCRRHHRLVHRRDGFSLGLRDGQPVFSRPDGSVLEDRAPPPS